MRGSALSLDLLARLRPRCTDVDVRYDLALLALFRSLKPPEEEDEHASFDGATPRWHLRKGSDREGRDDDGVGGERASKTGRQSR